MGSIFGGIGSLVGVGDKPNVMSPTTLDQYQQYLERLFTRRYPNTFENMLQQLNHAHPRVDRAIQQQLSGRPQDTGHLFRTGILQPALRNFHRAIQPQIEDAFAGQGATFSTRRGQAVTDALSGVYSDAQSQLAQQQFASVESARQRQLQAIGLPLQQTLGQIQGIQGISAPLLQFLGTQTQELAMQPGNRTQIGQGVAAFGQGWGGGSSGGGGGGKK